MAIIDTTPIRQEDLWPALIELGGQEVLEDYVLTLALTDALRNHGLEVLQIDIETEERVFSTITSEIDIGVLNQLLEDKGIGDVRKSQLIWRNAALRKLVKHQVSINDDAVQRMFSIIHGPTYPTRIIVVSTLDEANTVISTIQGGEAFSDIAIEKSIDASASRGGRVNPISTSDPVWPSPIREQISILQVNTISNPVLIGDRWVIIQVTDSPTTSDVEFGEVEPEMRRLATYAQERFLMETLARSLLSKSTIKFIDVDLRRTSRTNTNSTK